MTSMTSGDLAKDVLEAEEQLEMHQERKAEIDGRHEHYVSLKQRGEELVEQKHYASQEIQVSYHVLHHFAPYLFELLAVSGKIPNLCVCCQMITK